MSWNSIDGMIPRRIPLAKSILHLGPLSMAVVEGRDDIITHGSEDLSGIGIQMNLLSAGLARGFFGI